MAKSVKGMLYQLSDLSNDVSDTSSEDSYELYMNMQKVPDVPMPVFKKPLKSQKLFKRKSPSVLRVRRSAVMNDLGGHKQMIASTPMNPTSNIASSANSFSQLSPITGMLKNIDETGFVNTNHTSKDINVTRTNKCVNDNKSNRRSKSLENLSENIQRKQKKQVSASVLAVVTHLQKLSNTLRKESKEQNKSGGSKNQRNCSNIKDASSILNEQKNKITEQARNSIKEALDKELHKNNEHDLAGIAVLDFSSENDIVDNAKSTVEFCRYSHFPTRRTVLMERETQTTNSLENLFKKTSAVPSSQKEAEKIEKVHSVKRKIIESEETKSKGTKKSKTADRLAREVKQNNEKRQINKNIEAQTGTSLLESEVDEQEPQGQEFLGSSNQSLLHDATVGSSSTTKFNNVDLRRDAEDAILDRFLKNFDFEMRAGSIISIPSASDITLKNSSNNLGKSLLAASTSALRHKSLENLKPNTNQASRGNISSETATAEVTPNDNYEYIKDSETFSQIGPKMREKAGANTSTEPTAIEGPKTRGRSRANTSTEPTTTKGPKMREKAGANTSTEPTAIEGPKTRGRSRANTSTEPTTTKGPKMREKAGANTSTEPTAIEGPKTRGRSRANTSTEPTTTKGSKPRGKPRANTSTEPTSTKDSETVDQIASKKRATRGGSKNSKRSTLQQTVQIIAATKKSRSSTKVSTNESIPVQPNFINRLSGFFRVQRDSPVQHNQEPSCSGEIKPKRQRRPVKKYLQSVFIDPAVMKKSGRDYSECSVALIQSPKFMRSTKTSRNKSKISQSITKNKNITSNKKNRNTVTKTRKNNDLENIDSETDSGASCSLPKEVPVPTSYICSPVASHENISIQPLTGAATSRNKSKISKSVTKNKNKQKDVTQTAEGDILDVENIESETMFPLPLAIPAPKTSNKKNQNTVTKTRKYNNDLENIDSEIDAGGSCSLPKEEPVSTSYICSSLASHENISIQPPTSAGSQISKVSHKKSITFAEHPTQISRSKRRIVSFDSETTSNRPIHSQRCLVDNTNTTTVTDQQTDTNSNPLYAVINNKVVLLNWCCPQQPSELPLNGMEVRYTLKDLQSAAGTISCGQLIFAPKYQKPMQISKKHCITYKVEEGEAMVKVQTKKQIVRVGWCFHIPLGAEYTIINLKDEPLILYFQKISL